MRVLFFATAATALSLAAGASQAQESVWTGPYVGAQAGGGWQAKNDNEKVIFDTDLNGTFDNTVGTTAGTNAFSPGFCNGATTSATPGGCSDHDHGFEFGGRLGYDWQMGNFVVGAVLEGSRSDVQDSVTAYSTTPAYYTMSRKLKELGALRARAGLAMGDNLLYVTGGGAIGKLEHSFNTSNTANTFTTMTNDDTAKGYQLGAGVERKVTPNLSLGLEYLFTRLDDGDNYIVRAGGPAPATNPFILTNAGGTDLARSQDKFKTHTVQVTASYRF